MIAYLVAFMIDLVFIVEWSSGAFLTATSLSHCINGRLLVVDQASNNIFVMNIDTTAFQNTLQIGGHGWGNYEFDTPTDVASSFLLDIFVTDYNNRRIQRFDKNLNYIQTYDEQTLPSSVGRFQPRACAISTQGDLFVVELDGKRILKFDKRNQLVKEFGTFTDGAGMVTDPKDIAISQADEVFVLDKSKIIGYDIFGNYLRTLPLPQAEWNNIQVSGKRLLATSSDCIAMYSLDTDKMTIVTRDSIIGIPSQEQFVDATLYGENLLVLTASSLHYCSPTK